MWIADNRDDLSLQPLTRGLLIGAGSGFLMLFATMVGVALTLNYNHGAVARRIDAIVYVEEPTSAAAYEMEINVLGAGLGVLKYVSNGNPQHRARVYPCDNDLK